MGGGGSILLVSYGFICPIMYYNADLRLTFVPPYGPSADPGSSLRSGEGSTVRLGQYAAEERKSTCSRWLKVFLALCGLFLVIAAVVTLAVVLSE